MNEDSANLGISKAGRDLKAAITVGLALLTLITVTLIWSHIGFVLLLSLALSYGTWEVHQALTRQGMHSAIIVILICTPIMLFGAYAVSRWDLGITAQTFMLAMLALMVLFSFGARMFSDTSGFVKDAAASLFIISYIPLLGSFVMLMLAEHNGTLRIASFVFCIVANDTGGYLVGALFGKHKMAPKISPKKSWEGLAGSIGLGCLIGALSAHYLLSVSIWVGLFFGLIMVIAGTLGDLVESNIKRDVGIKDMSSVLPGHGGITDRLDSLLVSAPLAWMILTVWVP